MAHVAYTPRLDDAVGFALAEFRGTVRKGTTIPYASHLLQVLVYVAESGGDEDQLCAAVLHDWLEDIQGARREVLAERFGERVAVLVEGLSDSVGHPKPPWRARKERYLAQLRHEPPELRLISTADKLHNAQCIRRDLAALGPAIWERFSGHREGTLWYYDSVVHALGHGWTHPLWERLRDEVHALHVAAHPG